jgi:hypothetical protein
MLVTFSIKRILLCDCHFRHWLASLSRYIFLNILVADASRVSPRRATHFLLLRQEKVSKEKASRIRRPEA